ERLHRAALVVDEHHVAARLGLEARQVGRVPLDHEEPVLVAVGLAAVLADRGLLDERLPAAGGHLGPAARGGGKGRKRSEERETTDHVGASRVEARVPITSAAREAMPRARPGVDSASSPRSPGCGCASRARVEARIHGLSGYRLAEGKVPELWIQRA